MQGGIFAIFLRSLALDIEAARVEHAPNSLTYGLDIDRLDGLRVHVSVIRPGGKSPSEQRNEALAEVERLRAMVPTLKWHRSVARGWDLSASNSLDSVAVAQTAPVFRSTEWAWACRGRDGRAPSLSAARDIVIAALPVEWRPLVPELPTEKA